MTFIDVDRMELKMSLLSRLLPLFLFGLTVSAFNEGTLTNDLGRISNIDNDHIHVSWTLTLANCIRQCADFTRSYSQYYDEDCYAYNYDTNNRSCELIHSNQPLNYSIIYRAQWLSGFKYPSNLS